MKKSILMLAVFAGAAAMIAAPAQAATISNLTFTQDTTQRQFYVNNPEVLLAADLATATGGKNILQANINPGIQYRFMWEHMNKTGSKIDYAIQVVNPMSTSQTVQILHYGFSNSATQYNGGLPIANMMNSTTTSSTVTLAPFEKRNIIVQPGLLYGGFFSGVAELKVTSANTLTARAIAYVSGTTPSTASTYQGWISAYTGDQFGAHRTYKGIQSAANVKAENIAITIGDADAGTTIIDYQTHDVPGRLQTGQTARGDMVPIQMALNAGDPNTTVTVSPTSAFTYDPDPATKNMPPNLGNYGIKYVYKGSIVNNGTADRYVDFVVRRNNLNGNQSFAYRFMSNTAWNHKHIGPNQPEGTNDAEFKMFSVFVPKGGVPVGFSYDYILGAPAIGGQHNLIRVR